MKPQYRLEPAKRDFVLIGYIPNHEAHNARGKRSLNHDVCPIAAGSDPRAIIAAACEAPCGVMLIDLRDVEQV